MVDLAPTIQPYLDKVVAGGYAAIPPGVYNIATPLAMRYANNVRGGVLFAYGVTLVSNLEAGQDLLTISVANGGVTVRRPLWLGLTLQGTGKDGNGVRIAGSDNSSWLYNFIMRDFTVEGFGKDGINATGSVFEGRIEDTCPSGNLGNGMTLGNAGTGVMSSMTVQGGSMRQNGQCGLNLVDEFYDLTEKDVYHVQNGYAGVNCPNGITRISGGGFENNQLATKNPDGSAREPGPAITGQNFATIEFTTEGGNMNRQTSLLNGFYLVSRLLLIANRPYHGYGTVNGKGSVEVISDTTAPTPGNGNVTVRQL